MRRTRLRAHLDRLLTTQDVTGRIDNDPIRLPRRYKNPADSEVSALFAASYAYGKVDLFLGVLERLHEQMDARGGPAAYVAGFDVRRDAPALAGLGYRWTRDHDLIHFVAALRLALQRHRTVAAVFAGSTARDALTHGSEVLLAAAVDVSAEVGRPAADTKALSRGLRYFVPSPAGGSGCKRGNLLLRWMVRHGDGVDLGLWSHLSPADLIMPVDRHVQRIAPLLGLVERANGSWRSASAITRALATLCPEDPVKYDFALAHTGISSGCTGVFVADVCGACAVRAVCRHGSG